MVGGGAPEPGRGRSSPPKAWPDVHGRAGDQLQALCAPGSAAASMCAMMTWECATSGILAVARRLFVQSCAALCRMQRRRGLSCGGARCPTPACICSASPRRQTPACEPLPCLVLSRPRRLLLSTSRSVLLVTDPRRLPRRPARPCPD